MKQIASHRIQVLKSRAEIEALRDFWNSCSPARDADLDFYLFIVTLSAETLRPHVAVLYSGDIPIALLVGPLEEGRVPVKAGYYNVPIPRLRILRFIPGGCLGKVTAQDAWRVTASRTSSTQIRARSSPDRLFTGVLADNRIAISMDCKGAWRDNVFVERLWRSVKCEDVYLRAYDSVGEALASIGRYLNFYNGRRPHSSLDGVTPDQAYFNLLPLRLAA